MLETIEPEWNGGLCIVAATGESLTEEIAEQCRGHRVVAVSQAHRRLPFADVLYSCDARWWEKFNGCKTFAGERWSAHNAEFSPKLAVGRKYGLNLIEGRYAEGFSTDPSWISFGSLNACNSAFQAIGIALHKLRGPRKRIALVGVDLIGNYFYGKKNELGGAREFGYFIPGFERASECLPEGVEIVNCSEVSILKCFPKMSLADALS